MKFDYSPVALDTPSMPWVWRPVVTLDIFGPNNKTHKTLGLVDSGADVTLLNLEYAKLLGVDLKATEVRTTQGITGKAQKTYHTTLDIQVKHLDRITIPVGFLEDLPIACLLGQESFFTQYRIKFSRDIKRFELTPVKRKK